MTRHGLPAAMVSVGMCPYQFYSFLARQVLDVETDLILLFHGLLQRYKEYSTLPPPETNYLQVGHRFCLPLLGIQVYQPWLAQLGITYTQYLVLMVLWEQDGLPLNAISRRLFLESNTLTPLVKRMEAMKMVTRKKSKDDARQTIIALTEHGRALQQQASVIPDYMADELHERGMTDEEFAAIIPTLDHLIEALNE